MTGRHRRRRKQLLDDLKEMRGYWELKYHTLWTMAIDLSNKTAEGISHRTQNDGSQTERHIKEELDKNNKWNRRKGWNLCTWHEKPELRSWFINTNRTADAKWLSDNFHGLPKERTRNQQDFRIYRLVVGQNRVTDYPVVPEQTQIILANKNLLQFISIGYIPRLTNKRQLQARRWTYHMTEFKCLQVKNTEILMFLSK